MKREKLENAVVKAKADWRKVCGRPGATANDRRKAFAEWKKTEIARNKAVLIWRNVLSNRRKALANRRKALADRRKTHRGAGSLHRRKAVRRP